ncbi:hypothetical protein ACWCO0_16835 [Streptomyces tubercidicus]
MPRHEGSTRGGPSVSAMPGPPASVAPENSATEIAAYGRRPPAARWNAAMPPTQTSAHPSATRIAVRRCSGSEQNSHTGKTAATAANASAPNHAPARRGAAPTR